jgi:hypothetical protein
MESIDNDGSNCYNIRLRDEAWNGGILHDGAAIEVQNAQALGEASVVGIEAWIVVVEVLCCLGTVVIVADGELACRKIALAVE